MADFLPATRDVYRPILGTFGLLGPFLGGVRGKLELEVGGWRSLHGATAGGRPITGGRDLHWPEPPGGLQGDQGTPGETRGLPTPSQEDPGDWTFPAELLEMFVLVHCFFIGREQLIF